ncbi:SDR family NAD(P)-dependent oxidoreductase [Pleionea sp. CnH1-48]|uniref:SDR family NAD(P)-dependent oxidoreductase n=1 Tax=Pleionea sp. CnH1-48 TaxID=2954494 RepID=UPI002097F529|nr:SDR family NAD(P)-dependent oxidoreductase [Pleionea sp. CnH1-48]MCO7223160.1 SDR family NAD(P)-dependent oxidoreductase [Pleionea sp. CnH1-48]
MQKTILITGSTDGIGLATAEKLLSLGHRVLLHGRSQSKLDTAQQALAKLPTNGTVESYLADFSKMEDVESLAQDIIVKHTTLDVLINNAGIYNSPTTTTQNGWDIRFAVNTLAPYLLTQKLLPVLNASGRIVNLSSAAQASVNLKALAGQEQLTDGAAYAQSKLAITMWSRSLAQQLGPRGPMVVAVNPGSMLGSKMVKQAFGVAGGDIEIGADILIRAALSDKFSDASGKYFDNDSRTFSAPHPDALDLDKSNKVVEVIERLLNDNQ